MPTTKQLLDHAHYLATVGEYEEIISLLTGEVLALHKSSDLNAAKAKAYYNLGKAYDEQSRYEEAILAYDKCLELNRGDENSYYNKAATYYYDLELYSEALRAYEQYLLLTRDDENSYFRKTALSNIAEIRNASNLPHYRPIGDPIM